MLAERVLIERKMLYRRTVSRAARMTGSHHALAIQLGVSAGELAGWLEGEEMPPVSVFLRCIDLINASGGASRAG